MASTNARTSLLRGTSIVASLTLLSRLLGFVRELFVAKLLGATPIADAFFVAFRIPNLLRSFVAEGALTSAFVPVFTTSLKDGLDTAKTTLREVTGFLVLVTSLLSAIGILFAPEIVETMAPGFRDDPEQLKLCIELTRIMIPYIACVSIIAMVSSALNAVQIFGTAAWAQVWMNIVLIAGAYAAFFFAAGHQAYVLAWSVLIGGVTQLATQLPRLRRAGFSIMRPIFRFGSSTRELVWLMLPAIIGGSIYQVSIFTATVLASLIESGAVSWLSYADRIAQLPIGVFSIALASVLLPSLARAHSSDDAGSFQKSLSDSLRFTSFLILPLAGGIFALSLPITKLLFEHGAFTARDAYQTSLALQALALGLWASSCHSMLVRSFIARKDTVTPTLVGLLSFVANILIALSVMGIPETKQSGPLASTLLGLQETLLRFVPFSYHLGHAGIALATSLASYVALFTLAAIATTTKSFNFWTPFLKSSWKSMLATVGMVVVVRYSTSGIGGPLTQFLVGTAVGIVVFFAGLLVLRSTELKESLTVLGRIRRRRSEAK